jgi:hypothetical protein
MKKWRSFPVVPAVFTLLFTFLSCGKSSKITSVEREDLFKLDIGRLEDQIALFNLEGDKGIRHTTVAMRDGLFYISDGNGGKILRYNSYGDLLFMIYNEQTNPPPISLKPLQDGGMVTRWAVSYPLSQPGEITVDSRKHIYVRDILPYERHGFDSESKALLNNTILHFDEDGKFVEYLGREGSGGSPFPKIETLFTSFRDELAVVCRTPNGWDTYWFSADGKLLYMIQIKSSALPLPRDRDNVFPSLDTIFAGPDSRTLYVKVDYYRNTFDESTNIRTGIEQDSSVIWIMNVEDGLWEKYVDVPFFEYQFTEQNRKTTLRMLYSLLGIVSNGRIFLSFPVEGGYSILVMSSEHGAAGEQRQGLIRVSNEELQFNAFDLSAEGILSGLLVDKWQVKLVWWRTDKFLIEGFQ